MIGRILFGYYYIIIIYFLCLVGGQIKVSLFGFSSSVVLFVHGSSSFLSYSNHHHHHPLAFVMKRSSLVLLRQQFSETLIDKKFQAYDSIKRRNKRNVCPEPQQNLQYRMSMMLYESLSSSQNQRRQGNTKKRRRKKSNNNNTTYPNDDPKQKSIINSNTHPEQTVVILYYKPSNVITSHSNSDQIASSKKKKMDHPKKHDNQRENNNNNQQRVTVYDDIMSMKGYVPSTIINNKNHDSIGNTVPDDNDYQRTKNYMSFSQVTGIQSKLHAVGRLDTDTTGLLLLTNDGGLVHHVTNPTASSSFISTQKIAKTYEALIMGHHTLDNDDANNNNMNRLQCMKEEGINIGPKYGGQTQPPTELEILSHPTNKTTLVQISIEEGKNRQIRRMFHAIQSGVIKLHRSQIARKQQPPLTLDGLSIGQWRLLSKEEIELSLGWNIRTLPQPPSVSSFPSKKKNSRKKGDDKH